MESKNIQYLPSVDFIRGIAALWIVVYHGYRLIGDQLSRYYVHEKLSTGASFMEAIIAEGHTAVALFMVLSGFLFTWGAYGKRVEFTPFVLNRLLRIYPLYLVTIVIALGGFPKSFDLITLMCMILPLADFMNINVPGLTAMSWAVAIECQFYLLFPLLLKACATKPIATITQWVLILILLRILAVLLGADATAISYWHLSGRLDQFLIGMAAAVWLRKNHDKVRIFSVVLYLSLISATTALFLFHQHHGWTSDALWKTLWPTAEAAIWAWFIIAIVGRQLSQRHLYRPVQQMIIWVGVRSYSIYLLHFPILIAMIKTRLILHSLTPWFLMDIVINVLCIALPLTLMLSHFSFKAIELPFLKQRSQYLIS